MAWMSGFHIGFSFVDINNQMEDIMKDIGYSTLGCPNQPSAVDRFLDS